MRSAVSAVGQGVEVGQGGSGFGADVACADLGAIIVLFDQVFGNSELLDALLEVPDVEVHASGFKPPGQLVAGVDDRGVIPRRLAELVLDLFQCVLVVAFQVIIHHLLFLLVRIHDAGAADEDAAGRNSGQNTTCENGEETADRHNVIR